ncbi:MAG: lipopolysaccharide biosynthesis protein [Patescibacteria group bacterium]|nr:lipopolysaccharide biosynthesis protein [Patescibacteria group bacterium]
MEYRKTALVNLSWATALNIATGVFSFLKIVVVARFLLPFDLGLFGIAMLSLIFLELITETGVNVVIIQSKRNLKHYLDSAWVVSILRGFILTLGLIVAAPLISSFFNSPQSLNILIAMSFLPLIRGFINPSVILLQKELKFNYEFIFRISIFALDTLVTIILVVLTGSVFSLVWGLLAGTLLELIMSFIFIKPRPKLNFNKSYLSEIFHKGKWVTLYGVFNYFAQNMDDIAVGKILGASSLGIYQIAYKLSTFTVVKITDVINKVFFPLYSHMSEDKSQLSNVFFKSTFVLFLIVAPITLVLFIFPREIILFFLGQKWIGAVDILRILAFYGMLRSITGYPSSLFLALGYQKYVAYMTFSRAIVLGLTIIPFIFYFGIIGAAFAAIFSVIAEIPIVSYLLIKIFKKNETS